MTFKKGHIPWNKGLTKETSSKVQEMGLKISMSLRGHPVSEETRRKMSKIHKGKRLSENHRRRLIEANLKRPPKEELERLYLGEKHTQNEVAKELGVSQRTVYVWLKQYGIPVRGCSESHLVKQGIDIKRRTNIPPCRLAKEDMMVNYVLQHRDEFGYKDVYLFRTKDFDLIGVKPNGTIEKVEIEREPRAAIFDGHKCDRVIAYYGSTNGIEIPVTFVNKAKFIEFAERVLELAK